MGKARVKTSNFDGSPRTTVQNLHHGPHLADAQYPQLPPSITESRLSEEREAEALPTVEFHHDIVEGRDHEVKLDAVTRKVDIAIESLAKIRNESPEVPIEVERSLGGELRPNEFHIGTLHQGDNVTIGSVSIYRCQCCERNRKQDAYSRRFNVSIRNVLIGIAVWYLINVSVAWLGSSLIQRPPIVLLIDYCLRWTVNHLTATQIEVEARSGTGDQESKNAPVLRQEQMRDPAWALRAWVVGAAAMLLPYAMRLISTQTPQIGRGSQYDSVSLSSAEGLISLVLRVVSQCM